MKMKKQLLQRDKMIKCDKKKLPFRKINSYHKLHKFRYFFKSQYKKYLSTTKMVYIMIRRSEISQITRVRFSIHNINKTTW